VLQLAQLRVGRRGRDEQKGRKEEKHEPTQTWWGFDLAIAVAARVASDAATKNFMAMRHKIDSVYEKENRRTNSLVGKQWPSSGRPLYALIQGGESSAYCRQNAPLLQPPAALRCSEEHRIPVEHRGLVEEKAVEGAQSAEVKPCRLQVLPEQGKLLTAPSSRIPRRSQNRAGCSEIGSCKIARKRRGRGDQYPYSPVFEPRVL
jgi:hypothetical protein